MSRKYKFRNPDALYFVTFATVNWIDVFTRRIYKDILVDSLNYQFWQQHNQPIELTRQAFEIDNTIDYIHSNPVKAGFVERPEDYPYSSARDFSDIKGLVNIESC